jgi:MYND finger
MQLPTMRSLSLYDVCVCADVRSTSVAGAKPADSSQRYRLAPAADEHGKTQAVLTNAKQSAAGIVHSSDQQQHVVNDHTFVKGSVSSTGGSALARSDSSTEAAVAAAAAAVVTDSSSSKQKKKKVKQPCANVDCGQLTTKLCRRCAAVHYCSAECQKACFKGPEHKAQCVELASASM